MIKRLYVHNFRCFENFVFRTGDRSSILLVGKNGAGKTTVGYVLEILQKIARGTNRIGALAEPKDFTLSRSDVPMRFELEAEVANRTFRYAIAFEYPDGFRELRVAEESLLVGDQAIFTRKEAQVSFYGAGQETARTEFRIDWHLAALPLLQERENSDPIFIFRQWLSRLLILRPIPLLIAGESRHETLMPESRLADFGAWFAGLLAYRPAAYAKIDGYLRELMPDLREISNPPTGTDERRLEVHFSNGQENAVIPFSDLSDGEKCFLICAVVLAANEVYGPLTCFWDEPDNYLALSEVGHFMITLRKGFQRGGQFIATSHNPEAVRTFSHENTELLFRRNHLEPTQIRPINEIALSGDLVSAMIRGELEP